MRRRTECMWAKPRDSRNIRVFGREVHNGDCYFHKKEICIRFRDHRRTHQRRRGRGRQQRWAAADNDIV